MYQHEGISPATLICPGYVDDPIGDACHTQGGECCEADGEVAQVKPRNLFSSLWCCEEVQWESDQEIMDGAGSGKIFDRSRISEIPWKARGNKRKE